MMICFRLLAASVALVLCQQGIAASEMLRLICTYSYSVDDKGQRTPTSGEHLITVSHSGDGRAIIKKQGLGAEFTGSISHEEIRGETQYQIGGITFKETIEINRFTGSLVAMFGTPNGSGIVYYGTCRPASKQLF